MSAPESSSSDRASQSSRIYAYLHRYRNLLRKHWWVPMLTIVLALAAQGWRLSHTVPTYRSFGSLVAGARVQTAMNAGATVIQDQFRFYDTEVVLMQSSVVLERAAQYVKTTYPTVTEPNQPVKVTATIIPRSSIFQLAAIGVESNYTRLFLEAAMREYIASRREDKDSSANKPEAKLNDDLLRYERDLKKLELAEDDFRRANAEVLRGESGSAKQQLSLWDNELKVLTNKFSVLQQLNLDQQIEMLEKDSGAVTEGTSAKDNASSLAESGAGYLKTKRTIELKRNEYTDLATRLLPKHPKMRDLNDDIQKMEKLLEVFRRQSAEALTNKMVEMTHNIEILTTNLTILRSEVLDITTKMTKFNRIQQEIEETAKLITACKNGLIGLRQNKEGDPDQVILKEHASPAVRVPVNYLRELLLALAVGLAVGSGILFIMDRLDDRVATFTELQDIFDEPILGQVPAEKPAKKGAELKLLQPDDARHAYVEAYRNIRSSLLYMATEGKRAKTIVVTSAIPSDGKSKSSANLAITLAQTGSKVLLVDADLRRGQLHKSFGVDSGGIGFTEVLNEKLPWQQAVKPTYVPTLSLIPRGALSKNPGELFLKPITTEFIKAASEHYDYVLIDTAPVMAADDVSTLSPHVDGVVFVIRAGHTSGRIARAALDTLYQREVNVLGLIFNGVEAAATEYYFYKYKDYSNYAGT
jgi:capsular exopolysaccharide synthesis family protein